MKRSHRIVGVALGVLTLGMVAGFLLRWQERSGIDVLAFVRAALASVSINGGSNEVGDNIDLTSSTTSLAPDTGAYRWQVAEPGLAATDYASLYLPFNSGSTQTDITGFGRNGTLQGDAAYTVSGKVGGGIALDGTGDYITFANVPTQYPETISFWFNATDITDRTLVDTNGTFAGLRIYLDTSGFVVYAQFDNNAPVCRTVTSLAAATVSTWTHVAIRRHYNGAATLFVDGVFQGAVPLSTAPANEASTDFKIGHGFTQQDCMTTVPPDFAGTIDEFQMYNRLVSDAQINQLYADGLAGIGGPTTIKATETNVGQTWSLSVFPVTSGGTIGSAVTSSNTATVGASAPAPVPVLHIPDRGVFRSGAAQPITWSATDNTGLVNSIGLSFTSDDSSYNPISGATALTNATSMVLLNKWGVQSGLGSESLQNPQFIALDSATNVYVTDVYFNHVQKYSSLGIYSTSFGSAGTGNGQFDAPKGIAIDSSDFVYVADSNNNRIQKFDAAGTYQAQWGSVGSANGQFSSPVGVATDASSNIYVADTGNNRVQKFDSSGSFLGWIGRCTSGSNCNTTFAVTTSFCTDCSGVGSGSGVGQFNGPRDVIVGSNGSIYVADTNNNRVQMFAANGSLVYAWGTTGSSNGQFNNPYGLGVSQNGQVYVADKDNNRVQVFNSTGSFLTKWGSSGNAFGTMDDPFDVVVASSGITYLVENSSGSIWNRIHRYAPGGTFAWTVPASTDTSLARVKVQATDPFGNNAEITSSQTLRISTFYVSTTSPLINASGVSASANVTIQFNASLNPATVTQANVPVYGGISGLIDGNYSVTTTSVSNDTIVFNPTADFNYGERVQMTISSNVQSNTAKIAVPYVLKFSVEGGQSSNSYNSGTVFAGSNDVWALEVVDVNNDGNLDVIGMSNSNGIQYFQGDGTGSFSLTTIANTNSFIRRMVAQDLNKDGNIDIAYINSANIGVRLGNGDGTFATATNYASIAATNAVYAADLNGDGALDLLATADSGGVPGTGYIRVYMGNGDGTFASAIIYTFPGGLAYHLAIDDINNDGFQDVMLGNYWGDAVHVLFNNGDGSLRHQTTVEQQDNETAYHMYSIDITGDRNIDFMRISTGNGQAWVGNGTGNFSYWTSLFPSGEYTGADFDGDGDIDLMTSNTNSNNITVQYNNGSGVFSSSNTLTTTGNTHGIGFGDFNHDGAIDVVGGSIGSNNQIKVFLNNPRPVVSVVQPNGGEMISQSSLYNIIWSAYDNSGTISSVNLQLTTNDSSYSAIPGATGLANGSAYPFSLAWGSLGTGTGQFGAAFLEGPIGIDINSAGNIYVVDASNNRVQVFTPTGTYVSSFGSGGSGNGQFNNPRDVAFDSAGNIYVSDTFNHRVQKFNAAGVYLAQWGSLGSADGQFNRPWGIAIDSSDNIFVVEQSGNRVQKFDTSGVFIAKWGTAGSGNGQFNGPRMIDIDGSDNLYVTDESNDRVQKFSNTGTYLTQWGSTGTGAGQFGYPQGIAVDQEGNIFVSDANERVQKFTNTGTFLMEFGSFGTGNGQFDRPFGLKADAYGRVYVADTFNYRVQLFNPGGTFSWSVPATPTVQARVRAIASDGTVTGQDNSNAVFTIAGPNAAPTAPTTLYSNNSSAQSGSANPTGLTDQTPAFSAICNDPDSGDILNKYRVQVDNNNDFSSVIWDSGAAGTSMANCTAGNRSADINFAGTPLALDGATYFWRIKFWDDDNTEGVFSETISTNTFTMATQSSSIQRTQPALPSTPTADRGEASAFDTIRWYFTDTANNETGFRLVDANNQVLVDVASPDLTYLEETNLISNTSYDGRRVIAYNDAGVSALSNPFEAIVTALPPLHARIVSVGPDYLEVGTEETINGLGMGQTALQFELLPSAAAASDWVQTPTYRFENLQASVDYQVRVRGRNQQGVETNWSIFSSQQTSAPQAPTLTVDFALRLNDGSPLPAGTIDPRRTLNATVSVANVGTSSANNVFANVPLPTGILFVEGTLFANSANQTAAADMDLAQGNGNAVSSIWPTLPAGQTHTMTFQLRFDEAYLKSTLDRQAAAAALLLTLQASVSSQEQPEPVMSNPIILSPDVSVYAPTPEPEPTPVPQPVPVPTPEEVQTIETVTQQVFGQPTTQPSETSVQTGQEGFQLSVGSGSQILVVMGQARTEGDRLELRGTTNQPYAVITLIFNNSVTAIVVSDAGGEWRTFVDADQLGLTLGESQIVRIEVVAAKGDLRSERVALGEVNLLRALNGQAVTGFEPMVSATAIGALFGPAGERAVQAIAEQQPAIRTTLVVSAPVVVASSVPLWGYLPYVPTLLYHAIGWAVSTIAGRRKKRQGDTFGVVYDAITKQPLPLAIVRVYEQSAHRLVSTVVTDKLGRYDLLLPAGAYVIEVSKPQYQFPSSIVSGSEDGTFNRLYTGDGAVTVTTGAVLAPHIPVDPINDRRQWELAVGLRKVWLAFQRAGNYIATPLMVVGFVTSLALIAVAPGRAANWAMAALYLVTLATQLTLRPKLLKAWGVVYDLASNAILPLVTVQLVEAVGSKVVVSRLTDYEGRFTFLPEPGTYVVKATKNGFTQVQGKEEVARVTDRLRQPLPDTVHVTKPNERISGDIAMRQMD